MDPSRSSLAVQLARNNVPEGKGKLKSNKELILVYFAINRDEVMTSRDFCAKFGLQQPSADRSLRALGREGWLEVYETKRPRMWAAGPKLREFTKEE